MSARIQQGDNPFTLAQRLLGDGALVHELRIPGWNGDPATLPVGGHVYLPHERPGPPAMYAADPAHWGRRG